jgi:hypothetical protein
VRYLYNSEKLFALSIDRHEDSVRALISMDIGRNNVFNLFRAAGFEARQSRSVSVIIKEYNEFAQG